MKMPEVVNIVGTGNLGCSINYYHILDSVELPRLQYDPDIHQGLELRFIDQGPLVTIYSTGKYIIRANSFELLSETRNNLLQLMSEIDYIDEPIGVEFNINNIVYSGELGREVNLSALSDDLQLGEVVYDPESHPALRCRISEQDSTIMLFRTGKITVVGADTLDKARSAYGDFLVAINQLFRTR
jgi:transcription initiation factor TFIID TATA-box-binding protein